MEVVKHYIDCNRSNPSIEFDRENIIIRFRRDNAYNQIDLIFEHYELERVVEAFARITQELFDLWEEGA